MVPPAAVVDRLVKRRSPARWGMAWMVWCLTSCAAIADLPESPAVPGTATVRGQDEPQGLVEQLSPKRFYDAAKRKVGLGPNQQVAREAFAEAEKIFVEATSLEGEERKERFLEAAKLYDKAADRWPDSALQEDATVHARREPLLCRPIPEVGRSVRDAGQEVSQLAVHGHRGQTPFRHGPLLD